MFYNTNTVQPLDSEIMLCTAKRLQFLFMTFLWDSYLIRHYIKVCISFAFCSLRFRIQHTAGYRSEETFTFRINLPLFSTVVPSNISVFLSSRPFVVNTFSTGLEGVEERPTGKKNTNIGWDDSGKVGKIIN